jgi:hypothetical protein
MTSAFFILFSLVIYFMPTLVAWHKKNRDAILALNLLLGWTGLGWVAALVWGLVKD